MAKLNPADVYAALSRLLLPMPGDPEPRLLLQAVPGGAGLAERLPDGELEREHDRVFGHALSKDAPPYESSFGQAHVFMQSQTMADISGFYRAFGVAPAGGERIDHLAAELEFIQVLVVKETLAREAGDADGAQVCLDARRAFLRDHLGCWVRSFATRLRSAAGEEGFYPALADQIASFVEEECAALGVEPELVSAAELKVPEPGMDSACGSCNLSDFQ